MRIFLMLGVALVVWTASVSAEKSKPLSDSELAAISARGRTLAEYDSASWHATDAVKALNPAKGAVGRYIARKTNAGWVVVFGRFNETKDAFLIVYQATQVSSLHEFAVKTYDPPLKDAGFSYIAANAIEISLQNSHLERRPYNTYVLSLDSGQLYVYVLPAQTVADVYPLRGDTPFLASAPCPHIIGKTQIPKAIFDVQHSIPSGTKT